MRLNRTGVQIFDKETIGGQFALDESLLTHCFGTESSFVRT